MICWQYQLSCLMNDIVKQKVDQGDDKLCRDIFCYCIFIQGIALRCTVNISYPGVFWLGIFMRAESSRQITQFALDL